MEPGCPQWTAVGRGHPTSIQQASSKPPGGKGIGVNPATGGTTDSEFRYRSFVDPHHALIRELFPGSDRSNGLSLTDALAVLRERCAYHSRPGHSSFDELWAQWSGSAGRLEVNCISLVCLLVSGLRRAGWGENQAFVALAGVRGLLHHHAWALVRGTAGLLWINPADLVLETHTGRELVARHDVYLLFNDRHLVWTRAEKQRLLCGDDL